MSVALITGGASGIGLECSKYLLDSNKQNKVTIVDLVIPFETETQLIKQYGNRVLIVQADVTKHQQIYNAFKECGEKFHRLDIVLNNAGIGVKEQIACKDEYDLIKQYDKLQRVIDINLNAVIKVTMLSVLFMKQLQTPGHIINVSSMGGLLPQGEVPAYSASKHGVIGFTRSLSYLKKEEGIRINTLCPSFIETPLVLNSLSQITGKKVEQGTLINLGIAMHTDIITKAFQQMVNDPDMNGEVICVQIGNKISKRKFYSPPRLPGETERGGALYRIPSKEELMEFAMKIKSEKKIIKNVNPKL